VPEILTVRPTRKRIQAGLLLCALIVVAGVFAYYAYLDPTWWWVPFAPLVLFLWPLAAWIDTARTLLTVSDGYVRYRHGFLSQTTRTMDLTKIQDVRVERSVRQRLWGVGTLILETAGETGQIVMRDIDGAQAFADAILDASRRASAPPPAQGPAAA
jgi:membrane protein YdbS with pleckstrin-like domain